MAIYLWRNAGGCAQACGEASSEVFTRRYKHRRYYNIEEERGEELNT